MGRKVEKLQHDGSCKMSILTDIEIMLKEWENFGAQTIVNGFRTFNYFIMDEQNIGRVFSIQDECVEGLLSTRNRFEITVSFEEFVHFDDNFATIGTFSNEEIIQSTKTNQYSSDSDEEKQETIFCHIVERSNIFYDMIACIFRAIGNYRGEMYL